MEITFLPHERFRDQLQLCLDGDMWKVIHTSIFGKQPEFPSQCPDPQAFQLAFREIEWKNAKRYVLRLLASRSYSSGEMMRKLKQKIISDDVAQGLIDWCESEGYIQNKEWVESFVRVQTAKRLGPHRIKQKLMAKGIRPEEWEQIPIGGEQHTQIRSLLQTRYASKNLNQIKDKQKVIASLLQRGFEYEAIQEVIHETRRISNTDFMCD